MLALLFGLLALTPATKAQVSSPTQEAPQQQAPTQKAPDHTQNQAAPENSTIPNADRLAVDLRTLQLDMHLNADTGTVTTRARIHLRNGGTSPLPVIALQISSQLDWQSARIVAQDDQGSALPVKQSRVITDADHTGAANELALALTKPLAPGAELALDLYYGGTLVPSAERLVRLGAPDERATAADWDTVTPSFIGLRGFGNVLWYPVAAPATLLADGNSFARATDSQRQRTATTEIQITLSLEHTGTGLTQAWFLGQPAPLVSALRRREGTEGDQPAVDPDTPAIDTAHWDALPVSGHPVSLFVTGPASSEISPVRLVSTDAAAESLYPSAAKPVQAFLSRWLPSRPNATLTAVALPAPGTQAFADGALLVAPLRSGDPRAVAEALVYPMAAAAVPPDAPAWLRFGLPEFLRLAYLEANAGRDRMLAELGADAPVLQQAEASRGMDPAPLRTCVSTACARSKAAFALIMLRTLAGDAALQQALSATLLPAADAASSGREYTRRFQAALTQSSGKDLSWFFHDWFDADRGLPDLQIVQVAPRRVERSVDSVIAPREKRPVAGPIGAEPEAEADDPRRSTTTVASRNTAGLPEGSWLVAVEVQNNGDIAAEVPVIVRSSGLQNQLPLRIPPHGRATIRVPFETTPDEVWVNDGTVPEQRGLTHHRSLRLGPDNR